MEYTKENIGKRCPVYGGILTDINTLPIGTTFYVRNGRWEGKIFEKDGCKYVDTGKGAHKLFEESILALSRIKFSNNNKNIKSCKCKNNFKVTEGFIITFKSDITNETKGFEIHKLEDLNKAYEWCFENGFRHTEDFKHIRLQNFTPCKFE